MLDPADREKLRSRQRAHHAASPPDRLTSGRGASTVAILEEERMAPVDIDAPVVIGPVAAPAVVEQQDLGSIQPVVSMPGVAFVRAPGTQCTNAVND